MKKIFSYIGICLIIVLFFFLKSTSLFAETYNEQCARVYGSSDTPYCKTIAADPKTNYGNNTYPGSLTQAQIDKQNADTKTGQNSFSFSANVIRPILSFLGLTVLKIMAWFIYISGILLNYVLQFTVVDMTKNIAGMTGINIAWKVIRDLFNIAFIFLLVWEGLKMIMGMKQNAKGLIVGIVTASLLINFSLFFTKVIIDASNIATIGFYNSIIPTSVTSAPNNTYGQGLSTAFANALGISEFYSTTGITNLTQNSNDDDANILVITIMGSILFIVAAFVFFAVSCMFVMRYVVLVVLMALSPIAYFGMAFPGMEKYSKQWWETLNGQVLFAPIFMIMTWVVITLMSSANFLTIKAGSWSSLATGGGQGATSVQTLGLVINYAMVIIFLILCLTTAKSFAKKGSTQIADLTGKLTAFAGGAVMGGAAAVSRQTVGRAGNAISNSEYLKNKEATGGFVSRNIAKVSRKTGEKAATSSLDVRAAKIGGYSVSNIADFGKVDSKKTNFKADLDAKAKSEEERAKNLKQSDVAVAEAKATLESDEFIKEEEQRKIDHKNYIKSPEYRESKEFKELEALRLSVSASENEKDLSQQKINVAEAEIRRLRQAQQNTQDAAIKAQLEEQIQKNTTESSQKRLLVASLQKSIEKNQKTLDQAKLDEDLWMSEQKKALIKMKGGQEEKKTKRTINGKEVEVIVEQKIDSIYNDRVTAYADRIENEGFVSRYAKNLAKLPLVSTGLVSPTTKRDNTVIAQKVRGIIKDKKKNLSKKEQKALLEQLTGSLGSDDEDDNAPPAAAPTPATP